VACAIALLLLGPFEAAAATSDQSVLRVGVIAYENPARKIEEADQLLAPRGAGERRLAGRKLQYAVGTYAEVLDWISNSLVDIARLPPGAFAETIAAGNHKPGAIHCRYLVTQGKPSWEKTQWSNHQQRDAGPPYTSTDYNSVCLVRQDAGIATWADLLAKARQKQVQFIFIDPLSASGALVPMRILIEEKIDFRSTMEYSWGHADSLDFILHHSRLHRDGQDRVPVVFSYDRVIPQGPLPAGFSVLLDPPLTVPVPSAVSAKCGGAATMAEIPIPEEVWVASDQLEQSVATQVQHQLLSHLRVPADAPAAPIQIFQPEREKQLRARFAALHGWSNSVYKYLRPPRIGGATTSDEANFDLPTSLRDIYGLMLKYERTRDNSSDPLRLALVFSGGGAKCAYQAGVVAALEAQLARFQAETPDLPPEQIPKIDLVVGTSGGALNALPVALGLCRDPKRADELADTWRSLDIREIVRPKWQVRAMLGVCFAYFVLILVRPLVRWFDRRPAPARARIHQSALWLVLFFAGLLYVFPCYLPIGWLSAGTSHFFFYSVFCLEVAGRWAATCLLLAAVYIWSERTVSPAPEASAVLRPLRLIWRVDRFFDRLSPRRRSKYQMRAFFGAIALLFTAILLALLSTGSLFKGNSLVRAVASRYEQLLRCDGQVPRHASEKVVNQELARMSGVIAHRTEPRRDLVITGSAIGRDGGDRYFYWPAVDDPKKGNPFPGRGIPISEYPGLLLDLTLGSGTIFPMFPARTVVGLPRNATLAAKLPGMVAKNVAPAALPSTYLIDGGFSHNSPVEAAVLWRATHVLLIEASPAAPQKGDRKGTFLSNAFEAFNYLYDRAQINDVRAKSNVAVFTLRPCGGNTSVLDFGWHFADQAIAAGTLDALDRQFRRQVATPHFRDPLPKPSPAAP
jgi:predicted acylesterase/phospholipase RssA/ABC-type phosphate/phosphonate transport system substrate-binding protein